MQHEPACSATHEAASAHVQAVQYVGAAPCRCRAHMVAGERALSCLKLVLIDCAVQRCVSISFRTLA